MTKKDFIAQYIISRAYLHNTDGILEMLQDNANELDKNDSEDLKKISKGINYTSELETEIAHVFNLANMLENTIVDNSPFFDK